MTPAQTIRRLTKVEEHLESMILHLDAAQDEAGFMIAADFDRVFGSVTGQGNSKFAHAQNAILHRSGSLACCADKPTSTGSGLVALHLAPDAMPVAAQPLGAQSSLALERTS